MLGHLRRFEGAADAEILADEVKLHEAQYALATEYGFSSWDAMTKHIAQSVPTVVGKVSKTDEGATVIAGLEKVGWGGAGIRENSAIASLVAVLNVMGEPISYDELMGFSGAAFRVQVHQPQWCPSAPCAPCAPCGFDCLAEAIKAMGMIGRVIGTRRMDSPDATEGEIAEAPRSSAFGVACAASVLGRGHLSGWLVLPGSFRRSLCANAHHAEGTWAHLPGAVAEWRREVRGMWSHGEGAAGRRRTAS